jgi:hypothetical protein
MEEPQLRQTILSSGGWRTSSRSQVYPCARRFRARSARTVDRERMKARLHFIRFPMLFLGGVFVPVEALPA